MSPFQVHPGSAGMGSSPVTSEAADVQHSVLICDDNPQIRNSIQMLLADNPRFAVVGEAVDGDTCLEQVRQLRPDVLILDVNMPGGGPHIARATKEISSATLILVFSGSTDDTGRQDMLDAGAEAYVVKTGRIQPLLNGLEQLVD